MALWTMTDDDNQLGKPKYIAQSSVADDLVGNIFGVDVAETTAGNVAHAGWVKRTVGSGGRAGRVFEEVLVAASSITGDATDDTEYPDA